ncbi:MAG: glycoside hydrolase family 18 protein [Bacteroidales bacterium]|nr:glycoside hydrolase family 18 protein [Bacteroidales bacterium]
MPHTLYKYIAIIIMALSSGCLVDTHSGFDNVPPEAYIPVQKPIVAAYLHIGTRTINPYGLDLRGVDIVNLAFTVINNNRIGLLYPNHADNFMMVRTLKESNPNLRVLVSVGGYGTSPQFQAMASDPANRNIFVNDAVRFLKYFGFDGIDVDWEFPGMKAATRNADRKNFTALLSELRNALDSASRTDGKKYMLTIAAGAFDAYLSYTEPAKIAPLVDYFFVMTYDFVGQWNSVTGHHTNLYASSFKKNGHSVDRIVKSYVKNGIPPDKIVIGAAAYGRRWTQVQSSKNGLFRNAKGEGSIAYSKITELEKRRDYLKCWDKHACAPYLFCNRQKTFITYDNPESVRRKVDYVNMHSLGGIMYWEYFSDSHLHILHSITDEMRIAKGQIIMPSFLQTRNKKMRKKVAN